MPKPYIPRSRRILSTKITILGLMVILIFVSFAVFKNSSQQKIVDNEADKLNSEINSLERQNIELATLIEYFASSEFIEKEAREKLNLIKPGEKVVIIPEDFSDGTVIGDHDEIKTETGILRWFNYFFGI